METDGQIVHVRFEPKPEHAGFRQVVHGGVLATVLDELMVWACAVQTKQFAYCAEMTVRYQWPARPGEPLAGVAELLGNRRNRLYQAQAELRDEAGRIVASATGKYIPIPGNLIPDLLADVVSEPGAWKLDE